MTPATSIIPLSFSQANCPVILQELAAFCEETGASIEDTVIEALSDFMETTAYARLLKFRKSAQRR